MEGRGRGGGWRLRELEEFCVGIFGILGGGGGGGGV